MKNTTVKMGAKFGAILGAILYPFLGILPAFYFGSYGALILLSKLMGGTVEPSLVVRAVVVMGALVGLASAACLFLVVGGLVGTAIGFFISPVTSKETVAETE